MPQHDDGQDDVSALLFFDTNKSGDDGGSQTLVDALGARASDQSPDTTTDVEALRSTTDVAADDAQEDDGSEYQAKVTNLAGTVAVTALPDGSVLQIDLRPTVTSMSEAALADEILVIADLARQKGLAKQQAFVADFVRGVEIDDGGAAQELIANSTDLPTPQQAEAAQAEVFASRYANTD
ncbi:YbaB/EbfC family DNA-binding protein [Mycobacterium sp. Aquia_213]|uniref:YbaB/EbfC family DNA-binding protein n=1 Tax=Mycobacterium sp. Aquia_213 TaxID=2991728 RepID=UPI0022719446|nr:YbaB/EbfC family DNA-binding protein [Mycobacterium sp. Aquia_213]WAC89313.1 YbaB/EbfC family DNA-binding protein [Mycobacterium sp. Aquia_213]